MAARWTSRVLGRIDHQVKIRGYRIELGEIENQLLKLDKIDEAAVIARKDDDNSDYLCAYIVSKEDWTSTELSEWLEKELPHYMIPAYFVRLDSCRSPQTIKSIEKPSLHLTDMSQQERNTKHRGMTQKLSSLTSGGMFSVPETSVSAITSLQQEEIRSRRCKSSQGCPGLA